jgi:2-polyprenyl-3-methyl-5-hydroxy-6-metoxy-1,4-benzoquinol methylase
VTDAPVGAFEWFDVQPSCAHAYVAPVVLDWLRRCGARRVLDLGCGNGALTAQIALEGFDVTGLDASPSGIRIARQQLPAADLRHASVDTPLPPDLRGCFDAVIAVEVIEHLLRPGSLCARAREALVGGGPFILSTPYHGYLKNLALALAGGFDRHWHPARDGGHIKFFSRPTLAALLADEHFAVTRFARAGRIPWLAKSMIVEARQAAAS